MTTQGGRVCMSCGQAIADDDGAALTWAEGYSNAVAWQRWIHAACAEDERGAVLTSIEDVVPEDQRRRVSLAPEGDPAK